MRIAGNLPLLPQRLIVKVETLSTEATSLTVSKSGSESSDILSVIVMQYISQNFTSSQESKTG